MFNMPGSRAGRPGLYGPWRSYTPTITSTNGSFSGTTVNSARFRRVAKTIFVEVDATITGTGTSSGHILIGAPAAPANNFILAGAEVFATGKSLQAIIGPINGSSLATVFSVGFYDNGFAGATNNRLVISGVYEGA